MGIELLLLSYGVGLIPIVFGFVVLVAGRIRLSPWNKEPVQGLNARLIGILTMLVAAPYYAVISWAWSVYDR